MSGIHSKYTMPYMTNCINEMKICPAILYHILWPKFQKLYNFIIKDENAVQNYLAHMVLHNFASKKMRNMFVFFWNIACYISEESLLAEAKGICDG